ncbi:MAG: LysE family transporter [Fibrobacterota bacterium]
MPHFLLLGLTLGLSSGFSPGPLSTFILSQTLQYGVREGLKSAFAPLITDLPIIIIALLLMARIAHYHPVLGAISIAGGLFVFYLGYKTFRADKISATPTADAPRSLFKAVLVNFLSPNPYLFWFTVGAPTVLKGWAQGPFAAIAFIAAFYFCLVGGKACLALIAGQARGWLSGKAYGWLMKGLGILLFVFAVKLVWEGI